MIKYILFIIIIISCFLVSVEKLNSERKKVEIAKELESIIRQMSTMIKYQSADVFQLCMTCFEGRFECDYSSFLTIDGDFSEGWQRACDAALKCSDAMIVKSFSCISDFLGCYDKQSQITGLEAVSEDIKLRRTSIEEKLEKNKKMYLCLGAFFGIMICLILT